MLKKIILLFISWRMVLFIPLFLAQMFIPYRPGYPYASPIYFLNDKHSIVSNFLLSPWANFDGVYYLIIAANGYTESTAGFFPLFPSVINITTLIFGSTHAFDTQQYVLALILVSLFFLSSLIMIHKLVRLDFKNNIAMLTILAMLVFPTSFFYATIYSESLFLLLSLLSFYFARKKKWLWTGIIGVFLSATRLVGVFILPPLLYEYFKYEKSKSLAKLISILITPLGLISYAIYNFQKWGNPFYFVSVQGNFANNRTVNSIVLFPQAVFRYFKILFTLKPNIYEWWVAFFELSFFIFALVLFYIAWRKKIRISYLIFGILCFLIPASSGTFSGLPRYILTIFPLFITLALIKNKVFKIVYCIISVALLFLFFMLFSKGYFIA